MQKSTVISVRLPANLAAEYQAQSTKTGTSIADIVRQNLVHKSPQSAPEIMQHLTAINNRLETIEQAQIAMLNASEKHSKLDKLYSNLWETWCLKLDKLDTNESHGKTLKQFTLTCIKLIADEQFNDKTILSAERFRCLKVLAASTPEKGQVAQQYIDALVNLRG